MSFQAGRLKHRITIRRLTDVPNGRGAFTRGWTTVVDGLPAEVVNISGREALIGAAMQGISTYRIVIRRREGIRQSDQIIYRGMELNIREVGDDPLNPEVADQILADTETPQGAAA